MAGFLALALPASAQSVDAFFGFNALTSPKNVFENDTLGNGYMGGGLYPSIGATLWLVHGLGVNGEVAWRGGTTYYYGVPIRLIFYDFNLAWNPISISRSIKPDLYVGLGADSLRAYEGEYICTTFSCSDYVSSTHGDLHLGADVKVYVTEHLFVRPEIHWYDIRHDYEYNVPYAWRLGVSIGYTLGGS